MSEDRPVWLTVFYDASCRLCAAEMERLKSLDADDAFELVDCSSASFDESPWRAEGVTREALLASLHIRDASGVWLIGVDALGVLYRTVGLEDVARSWTHPRLRGLSEPFYAWVARHRHALSRLGLHRVAPALARLAARRSLHDHCEDGRCAGGHAASR